MTISAMTAAAKTLAKTIRVMMSALSSLERLFQHDCLLPPLLFLHTHTHTHIERERERET